MKLIFITLMTLLLIGCGGGGDDSSSSQSSFQTYENTTNTPIQNNSFNLWDYTIPNSSTKTRSITSKSLDNNIYHATFRSINDNKVEEIPQNTQNEKIVYEKKDNYISVNFYKDNQKKFQYSLKKYAKIGEQTTIQASSCMLVDHFDSKELGGTTFNDVIQINCGKHKGYYAKGKGEVFKE